MKTILLLFILCSLSLGQDPLTKLIGKWQLKKVETIYGTIIPKYDFILTISKKRIEYNLDVNYCVVDSFSIDNNMINFNRVETTLRCCDGINDSIANYLKYCGTYKLQDSLLTISNDRGIIYLKKK